MLVGVVCMFHLAIFAAWKPVLPVDSVVVVQAETPNRFFSFEFIFKTLFNETYKTI